MEVCDDTDSNRAKKVKPAGGAEACIGKVVLLEAVLAKLVATVICARPVATAWLAAWSVAAGMI